MMSFLGLYRVKVIGTKVCPKEPVPPVIKIEEFESILFKRVGGHSGSSSQSTASSKRALFDPLSLNLRIASAC